jgi:hypothetical protein
MLVQLDSRSEPTGPTTKIVSVASEMPYCIGMASCLPSPLKLAVTN